MNQTDPSGQFSLAEGAAVASLFTIIVSVVSHMAYDAFNDRHHDGGSNNGAPHVDLVSAVLIPNARRRALTWIEDTASNVFNGYYPNWFSCMNSGNQAGGHNFPELVKANGVAMTNKASNMVVVFSPQSAINGKEAYGYTTPNSPDEKVFLTRFWVNELSSKYNGFDTGPGVIIHEAAHRYGKNAFADFVDHGDGSGGDVPGAYKLATNAESALDNAQSYRYFAEQTENNVPLPNGLRQRR